MAEFKKVVLRGQLQITLHELKLDGAQDITCTDFGDKVEISGILPERVGVKPRISARIRFGGRKRSGNT
jgi:hypothetical protein